MGNCLPRKKIEAHKNLEWKLKFMIEINNEFIDIKMSELQKLGIPRDILIGIKSNINIEEIITLLKPCDRKSIDHLIETDPITIKKLENFVYDVKMYKKITEILDDLYLKVLQANFYNNLVTDDADVIDIFDDVLEKADDVEMYEGEDTESLLVKTKKKKMNKIFLPEVPTHKLIPKKMKGKVVVPV